MIDDPHPAARVYVTVGGKRWELTPTNKMTWPEAKEAKRICGLALVDMEAAIQKADPDAWFAWLFVSIRRQWPALTEADLTHAIGDTPIVAVIETVEDDAPEVAFPDPPASASVSDATANGNDSDSGSTTLLPSTRGTAGQPTSLTQT